MLQVEVCFLCLPPGFRSVPRYFDRTSVVPQPLTEPDKGFPTSGSSLKHSATGLSVFGLCSQCFHALNRDCVSPCSGV